MVQVVLLPSVEDLVHGLAKKVVYGSPQIKAAGGGGLCGTQQSGSDISGCATQCAVQGLVGGLHGALDGGGAATVEERGVHVSCCGGVSQIHPQPRAAWLGQFMGLPHSTAQPMVCSLRGVGGGQDYWNWTRASSARRGCGLRCSAAPLLGM